MTPAGLFASAISERVSPRITPISEPMSPICVSAATDPVGWSDVDTLGLVVRRVGAEPPMVSTGPNSVSSSSCKAVTVTESLVGSPFVSAALTVSAPVSSGSGCGVGASGRLAALVSAPAGAASAFFGSSTLLSARRRSRSATINGGSINAVYSRLTRPEDHVNSIKRSTTGSLIGAAEVIVRTGRSPSLTSATASRETIPL